MAPLCLERAGTVPLDVDITVSDVVSDVKGDGDFLEPLLPHISKVYRLRLIGYSSIEVVANDLPGFFASPMPDLSTLELQQDVEPVEVFPLSDTAIPPVFQEVSKLKSLCLTRTPIYPTLFSITSLKELKLLGYASLFDFGTFIGFLRSNIDLECLVLDVQFITDSVETAPARKVALPRLQYLSITCSKAIDSKGLLSCISLPRGVNIEVISTKPGPPAEFKLFLPSPPTLIQKLLTPITAIKVQIIPQELHFSGNGSAFTFRAPDNPPTICGVLMSFPITLRELHLNIHPQKFTDVGLSNTMKTIPALEILAISGATKFPIGLFSVLKKEPVLCPALKTIAFLDCGIDQDVMKELGEALARRRDSTGARVCRVVIVSSTGAMPDRRSVRRLRKSVPCVDVRMDDKLPDLS